MEILLDCTTKCVRVTAHVDIFVQRTVSIQSPVALDPIQAVAQRNALHVKCH